MIKTQHQERKNIKILGVEFDWHSDVKISIDDEGDNNVYLLYVYVTNQVENWEFFLSCFMELYFYAIIVHMRYFNEIIMLSA